jgi:hypothetical protein
MEDPMTGRYVEDAIDEAEWLRDRTQQALLLPKNQDRLAQLLEEDGELKRKLDALYFQRDLRGPDGQFIYTRRPQRLGGPRRP